MTSRDQNYWAEKGWELKDKEFDAVRDKAGKWKGTISSLAGVSGVVAVISAREPIEKLSDAALFSIGGSNVSYEYFSIILLLAALGAIILAIWRVSRAELGPMVPWVGSPDQVCSYTYAEPGDAADAIKESQWLTLGSVVLLVVATLWIGYAKKDEAGAKSYLAVSPAGVTLCGQLVTDANGAVSIKTQSGTDQPVAEAAQIVEVGSCNAPK